MDIIIGILTLMGLGFIFWLIGAGVKSGLSAMLPNNVESDLEEVRLYNERSLSGISKVTVAYRHKRNGYFTANVICKSLGRDEWAHGENITMLQKHVAEIYERNDKDLSEQRKR